MKKKYEKRFIMILAVLLSLVGQINGQITIHSTDFANVNDTIRLSLASPQTAGIDLTITGSNTTWDFSQLQWTSQTVDTFSSVFSAASFYAFLFFLSSDYAVKAPDITAIPGFSLTNVFNIFDKTSTVLQETGTVASLNGTLTPLVDSLKDVVYRFPLNFGNMDTSHSARGLSLPGVGSYFGSQTRLNNVDGWGTLITPFGTFNTLRVKSELTGHDSLFVSTLSTGFGFDRNLTREYKWLATGMKEPVLQINTTEAILGNEQITSIVYRDSSRAPAPTSIFNNEENVEVIIYPNPVKDLIKVQLQLNKPDLVKVELLTASGQLKYSYFENEKSGNNVLSISTTDLPSGIYMLKVISSSRSYSKPIIISGK